MSESAIDTSTPETDTPADVAAPAKRVKLANEDGTPTPAGWRHISTKLQQTMPTKSRRGRGGMQFDYITARQVQERLDDVVGPGNWSTCFRVLHHDATRNVVVVECAIRIFGVEKSDVGTNNNPDIPEYIEAKDRNGVPITDAAGEARVIRNPAWEDEPFKASYSDSFKRAAVSWGCGRWLYGDT